MASKSSSSSLPSYHLNQEQYDVFLSFRGEDTRLNFTSHLHAALSRKKILTFVDDKQIKRGDEISSTLLNAIERSKISIVIFSEKYATSQWCLDELVKIMECKKTVIPVFYHVDPTHVRNQSGPYKDAFTSHEIHNQLKVLKWRTTLKEAGSIAGWTSSNRLESELVESIVEDVLQKLNRNINLKVPSWLIGINNRIAEVQCLLCIGSTDVRIIGIWGMGGIGKTTIAEVLYNTFSFNFQGCCFVQNVRENWKYNKQDELRKLHDRKALIVLDDVSHLRQIEYLVGEKSWFGLGTRIIVTTRNKEVFRMDDTLYEVKPLNTEEGLQLLSLKAFREDQPKVDFIHLSNDVVTYSGGIPLVLEVLGSFLHSKSPKEWKSTLQKLKKVSNKEIHQVLNWSYEELDPNEQKIFLDIACFFKGWAKSELIRILDSCGFSTDIGLRNLQDKSLITISKNNKVNMHDLIQEMGWNIVHQESLNELEKQSRLWDPEEIYQLLKCKKDTNCSVEAISMDVSSACVHIEVRPETFARMSKLRILNFRKYSDTRSKVHVSKAGLESLPNALRYFRWDQFPMKALPSSFRGEMLVELHLFDSRIEKLWDAELDLTNLKSLCLSYSEHLVELSNLSKAENLEEINLDHCIRLQKVSSFIFSLPRLLAVDLCECINLRSIQSDMVSRSLRWLNLKGCSSLVEFSVCSKKFEYLNLDGTAINQLPISIQRAKNLIYLSLSTAKRLKKVPPIFETLWSIRELYLIHCSNLSELPDNLGLLPGLQSLSLSGSNIKTLPESIKLLSKLRFLDVSQCKRLRSLPELPILLRYLNATGCISLKTMTSSAAAMRMKNCFGSQNKRFLLGQIQELKLSPRHHNYWEKFEFQDCTKLNEDALETIVSEAIMRIKYAAYLSSIDDDPYHQFHLTSKDFDAQNFEDTCRQLLIEEFPTFPPWDHIQETASSALTIKVNANCCEECKASHIAFFISESENTNFGFDGRHRVCMKHLDEHAARLPYDKLRYNNVSFNFPGSRVPSCFRYRTTETTQITMALPAHSHVLAFAFSLVLSHYPYDDDLLSSFIRCECYSTGSRSIQSECFYEKGPESFADTVFLWYDAYASNWILDESKSNCCLDFVFSFGNELYTSIPKGIKECGVWPIYTSDLESENPIESMKLGVQPNDLRGDNTSGIDKQDELHPLHLAETEEKKKKFREIISLGLLNHIPWIKKRIHF